MFTLEEKRLKKMTDVYLLMSDSVHGISKETCEMNHMTEYV